MTNNLRGKSFCFTGAASVPRKQLWEMVEQNGGIVHKSCTQSTDYLVVADMDSLSIKIQKAVTNGVMLITEKEFNNFVDWGL